MFYKDHIQEERRERREERKRCSFSVTLFSLLSSLFLFLFLAPTAQAQTFEALVFSKTAGFRHASIPSGIAAIQELGAAHGFAVTATEDAGVFTDETLAAYDVVIFLSTTGDVLNEAQQAAFERYIAAGGGFVGIHAAADTEYDWDFYGDLVGAYFQQHPHIQQATVKVADPAHPSTAHLPKRWTRTDEWYDYRANPRGTVHVLATLEEATYSGGVMGHDHPIAWCQVIQGGRSWYTGGGHTSESYSESLFREHLLGGIRYAAGIVEGDCRATVEGSFEKVVLVDDVDDAVDLAVLPDGRVLFIEMDGSVKLYDPATATTRTAAQLNVYEGNENGLIGLVLDPNFAQNQWLYLFYTPAAGASRQRVARFTLLGHLLDPGSEKVLLEVPITRDECCHAAGSMAFDADGNLFIALGDDTNPFEASGYTPIDERPGRAPWDAQRSSGNTADLRGKILRITPQPNGTYTIPEGNLFPDGEGGRAEIYTMGLRNPYRITVDTETGWLYWGDVGPDGRTDSATRGSQGYDEWNQARGPGNFGWPYCIGPNQPFRDYNFATRASGALFDCANPVNDSPNNTGSRTLPPAQPAWIWYPYGTSPDFPDISVGNGRTAMAGPVYHYDEALTSATKLPAYYDDTFFIYEWSGNWIKEIKLDDDGQILEINPFAPDIPLIRPISMRVGPEGALYVLEWGSGFNGGNRDAQLVRIDYRSGPRAPVAVLEATPTAGPVPLTVHFSAADSYDPDEEGGLSFSWDFDADGDAEATGLSVQHTYTQPGSYTAQLTVTDESGRRTVANVAIVAGNTPPAVTLERPVDGGFFAWGDEIPFRIAVTDAEDGGTAAGTISCAEVTFQPSVGHDDHGHPATPVNACEGTFVSPPGHGVDGDNIFQVVEANYTDAGAPGTIPLTTRVQHVLHPRRLQAEHFSANEGTTLQDTQDTAGGIKHLTWIDDGDYLAFERINLHRMDYVTFRIASAGLGGRIEVRVDTPEGLLISTAHVERTGNWQHFRDVTARILDPGGTNTLYFVFKNEPGNQHLFNLNWIEFHGPGVANRDARGHEGLQAMYFKQPDFSGDALLLFDPQINFNWRTDAPAEPIPADQFSVQWTGQVKAEHTEAYTFYARTGDQLRLWLDDQLVIDHAAGESVTETSSAPIQLEAGKRYDIRVDYAHATGEAQAHVSWSSASTPKAIIPARLLYPNAGTGIANEEPVALPDRLTLDAAYPNPFSVQTTLGFSLPETSPVRLEVFDVMGRRVAVLVDEVRQAGRHTVTLHSETLSSGLYLCRLTTPTGVRVQQVAVVR